MIQYHTLMRHHRYYGWDTTEYVIDGCDMPGYESGPISVVTATWREHTCRSLWTMPYKRTCIAIYINHAPCTAIDPRDRLTALTRS